MLQFAAIAFIPSWKPNRPGSRTLQDRQRSIGTRDATVAAERGAWSGGRRFQDDSFFRNNANVYPSYSGPRARIWILVIGI